MFTSLALLRWPGTEPEAPLRRACPSHHTPPPPLAHPPHGWLPGLAVPNSAQGAFPRTAPCTPTCTHFPIDATDQGLAHYRLQAEPCPPPVFVIQLFWLTARPTHFCGCLHAAAAAATEPKIFTITLHRGTPPNPGYRPQREPAGAQGGAFEFIHDRQMDPQSTN